MAKPPSRRKTRAPLFEELERRILLSADAIPLADMATLDGAEPAVQGQLLEPEADESPADAQSRTELVFVDTAVEGYETLVEDLRSAGSEGRTLEVFLIDGELDGVEQITDILADYQGIDAIHVVSHGSEGAAQLGNAWLSNETLSSYEGALQSWGTSLSEDADLLFYGCDLAGGASGEALVSQVAKLTGADVAASDDLTGAAERGGDWTLEVSTGAVETSGAFSVEMRQSWEGVLEASAGTAIWTDSGSTVPQTSDFDGTSFGLEGTTADVGTWRTVQGAEAPTRDEMIVVGIDEGGTSTGMMWNGSSWSPLSLGTLGSVSETYWYGAEVAYESQSGDAVLIWNDDSQPAGDELRFSVWDGTSWTDPASIAAYSGAEPQNLRLASSPTSDEMVLVVSDANADDHVLVWNGSSWGDALMVDASGTAENDQSGIAVAYESQSGHAMVVYGHDGDPNGYYRIWNGTSWEAEATITAPAGVTAQTNWTTLASDPNSDRIALGVLTSGGTGADVWLTVWDGSAWEAPVLAETGATGSIYPNLAVAFESQSGQAIAVYGENGQSEVRFRTWSAGVGWSAEQIGPNVGAIPNSMTLDSDPGSDGIMLSVQDGGSDLNMALWDGTSWGTVTELETDTGETKNQPFLYLWDQQAATRADSGGVYAISEGDGVTLDASGSIDAGGSGLTYRWDLDADGSYDLTTNSASISVGWATLASYGLGDDGGYEIGLEVEDALGATATSSSKLIVTNTAPVITVTGDPTVSEGAVYTIDLAALDPGDDTITSWIINWGDGSIETIAGGATSAGHVYGVGGMTFDITVSAIDEDGVFTSSDLLTASDWNDGVYLLDGNTGDLQQELTGGASPTRPAGVAIGPDGDYYITSSSNDSILRFDSATGTISSTFVASGSGGLNSPFGLTFGPDGNLYVASYATGDILRYDGSTGAFIDVFVADGSGGVTAPSNLEFGPDGQLYVTDWFSGSVHRFDGATGAYVDDFAGTGGFGATDVAFGPDGNVYVSNSNASLVYQFDGATGALLDSVAAGSAYQLEFGPDGNLYVSSWAGDAIERFDISTMTSLGTFADATDQLDGPWGIEFTPDQQVTVIPNVLPTANPDSASVSEGGSVVIDLAANDTDPDHTIDVTSIVITSGPANGTLVVHGDGTVTYTHDGSETTSDTFSYTITDATGAISSPAVVSLTVTATNDAPIIGGANGGSILEGANGLAFFYTNGTVADADSADFDGGTLTLSLASGSDGTERLYLAPFDGLSVTGADVYVGGILVGSFSGGDSGSPLVITFNSNATLERVETVFKNLAIISPGGSDPATGIRTLEAVLTDGDGGTSNVTTVDVTINAANDPPTAATDSATVPEGGSVLIDLAANDSDPEGALDLTSIVIASGPAHGSVVVNGDGTVTYTHNGSETSSDSFTYTIADASGATSAVTAVSLTVNPVNDAPTVVTDTVRDEFSTDSFSNDDGSASWTGGWIEVDDGGAGASAGKVTVTGGELSLSGVVSGGGPSVTREVDLSGASGATLSFDWQATAGVEAGEDVILLEISGDGGVTWTILETFDEGPGGSSSSYDISDYMAADTQVRFRVAAAYGGPDETFIVDNVEIAYATPQVTTAEDTPYAFSSADFGFSDSDGGSLTQIQITSLPAVGSLELSGIAVTAGQVISVADLDAGNLVLIPDPDESGVPYTSFGYTVHDGTDYSVRTYTMTVDVTAVNDSPAAVADAAAVDEGSSVTIDLAANDTDLDDALDLTSIVITSGPANGTLVVNGDGTVTYTHDGSETTTDSFTYTIQDASGAVSNSATVSVTVAPTNDDPTNVGSLPTAITVTEDQSSPVDLSAIDLSDVDAGNQLVTIMLTTSTGGRLYSGTDLDVTVSGSGTGTLWLTGSVNDLNQYLDAPGLILYQHGTAHTAGDGVDTIQVDVRDNGNTGTGGGGTITLGTVNVDITPVNDAPVRTSGTIDDLVVVEDSGLSSLGLDDLLYGPGGGTDELGQNLTVEVTVIPDPNTFGTIYLADGTTQVTTGTYTVAELQGMQFQPAADESGGPSFFSFRIYDDGGTGNGGADFLAESMQITITPENDAPTAVADTATVDEGSSVVIDLAANDTDLDNALDLTSIVITSGPANGTLVVNNDGTVTYTHDGSETTTDSFTYTIQDASGAVSNGATVSLTVNPVNDAPTAVADSATVDEGASVVIDLAANDTDLDDTIDLTSIVITSPPANGTLVVNNDGTVTYTHDGSETTTDSFTYTIQDASGAVSNGATVSLTVNPINDAPTAVADTATVDEGASVVIDLAANDTDLDNALDLTSIVITSGPANGTLVVNNDGTVTYTHDGSETTTDSFTYTIQDASGAVSNGATVSLTVNPINDAPTAVADTATVDEGSSVVIDLAANDTDLDGAIDLTSIVITSPPANGTLVVNNDGTVTYTHDGSETTTDSFTYTIQDASGAVSNGATVSLTVNPINDAPTAVADTATVDEGSSVVIDLAANDTDLDGAIDLTSIVITSPPANGTLVVNNDGTVTYTHDGSETTTDSFTYTIQDASGAVSNGATVSLTVNPINDAPTAVADTATVDEGSSVVIDLAANDTDLDDTIDLTSIVITSGPANGTLVVNNDGTVTYTHDGSETTTDSFTYTIQDASGAVSNGATVSLTVNPVNDAPTAVADTATVDEGASVVIDLAANDTDLDNALDLTSIVITSGPANGTLVVNNDGTVTYTHDGTETTTDSFTYTIQDASGAVSNGATVSLTVNPINDAPTAVADTATVDEGASVVIDLAANDTDLDDTIDLTSIVITSGPANGTLVVNDDGTVTYTHDGSETTTDSFTYTIQDASGATSNGATVSLTVNPVNDAPTAVADTATVDEGASVVIDLAGNDTDLDDTIDLTSIVITSGPANGTLVVNNDGTVTYTHDGSETTTDSFTYTIQDASGAISNGATVSLTVNPVNDAPTAVADTATVDEGSSVVIDLAANDTDLDDTIDLTSIVITSGPANGTLVVNNDGTVTYTHDGSETTTDSFTYTIQDASGAVSNGATVSLTVNPINDAPTAVADTATVDEGNSVVIDLAGNDTDLDDTIDLTSIVITSPPANGTLVVNNDGTVTYTHDGTETTTDSFTYTIQDASGAVSNGATVSLTVNPVNDAPTAVADTATVDEGASVVIDLAANDTDLDDTIDLTSIVITSGPANGTLVVNNDGTVTYTHDGSETTTDSFTYTIQDASGAVSNGATVSLTVNPVNDAPTAVDDTATVDEGSSVVIDLAANDTDLDNALDLTSIVITSGPANGTLVVNNDGTVTYTHDGSETTTDSFTYTIQDASGAVSNGATVSLTVNPVNDAPTAVADTATVDEGASVVIDLAANDTDLDDTIDLTSIVITSGPANGTLVVNNDGTVTYTHDGSETTTDSFSYTIQDASGAVSNGATVSLTVNSANDPPTAVADTATVDEGNSVVIDLAANDTDLDNALDLTSIVITSGPANGTLVVNNDGTVTYTHDGSETTTDSFTYTIQDASGAVSNGATVSLTVNPVNDAPTAVDDTATVDEGASVVIDLAANDTDLDDTIDLTSIVITSPPANGTLVVNNDGTVTYTHDGSETTTDSFTYTIQDASGAVSNGATVSLTVNPINDAPTAVADTATVDEGASVVIDLAANDTDLDDTIDLTSIVITSPPANGTLVVNNDGTVTYTHDGSETTTDSFSYTIQDASGAVSNGATVSLTVNSANDPPTAVADTATVDEGNSVVIDLAANDTDLDNALDLTSIVITSGPANGTLVVNNDGTVTYTHDGSETTTDSFTYTIQDASGAVSNGATVSLTVNPINDAPTAVADTATVDEGASVVIDLAANDTDLDDTIDLTSIVITSPPANGTLVVNNDGTVTYTHDGSETTTDSFSYTIQDASGAVSNGATVSLTVNSANDPPTAVADTATVDEGNSVVIDLAANDTDLDNALDLTSIVITSGPANGTLVVNNDGTVTYTHDGSETTTDSFTYTIQDASGAVSNGATVSLTVNPINDAPTAVADSATVDEGASVVIDLAANDTDLDDTIDLTSIVITSGPANGTLVVNNDGTVTYTHDGSETTTDSFTYTIQDASGAVSNGATVSLTVNPINDAPTAVADTATVDEGASVVIDLAANDTDLDDTIDLTSIVITSPPANGTLVVNNDGTVTYTHDGSETTTDSFSYTIQDASGAVSNGATVSLTVNPVNDAPTAVADTATVDEGASVVIDLAANDTDLDNALDLTSIVITSGPANGTLVVNNDGTVTYTHDGSETTTDSFTYTIQDASGAVSNGATVSLTVNPVNDAPTAVADSATVDEGSSVVIDLAANDTDLDDAIDLTSIVITSGPANGTLVVNNDGTVTYTHDGSETTTDSFTYTIQDASGAVSNGATVSLTVNPVNDAPTAVADTATVDEGASVVIDLAGNDTDLDDAIDLTSIVITSGPANGTLVVNNDGTVTYTHDGSETTTDSFTYTIQDASGAISNGATVSLTVNPINDAPTAVADTATVDEGSSVVIDLAANDTDLDNALDLTSIVITSGPANGTLVVNNDGTVTYTHDGTETTTDSFTYTIQDASGAVSNGATVSLTVNPINDAPTAVADTATVDEGNSVVIDLAANDTDLDDTIDLTSIVITSGPANGTLVVNNDGTVTYTHDGSETTTDSFSYTIQDASGAVSNGATVSLTVNSANDPPTAVADTATVDEGNSVVIDLAANDTDLDNALDLTSIVITSGPANGTLVVNNDGTVTYTHDGSETTTDSFTYTIQDASGAVSNGATVSLTVNPVNDAPTAVADSATVDEGASVVIDLAANDTDLDNALDLTSIVITSGPANGTLVVNNDGTVTYTHDGTETTTDSFTYTIQDASGAVSNGATVSLTVNSANDPPTAVADTATVDEGSSVVIDLAANDTDLDNALDLTSIVITSGPANGTLVVNNDGTVTYTHDGSETTTDSFTYTIQDASGAVSNGATVSLTVNPINDAPTAVADTATVDEGSSVVIDLAANDTDLDDTIDLTSIVITSGPANGTLVVNNDGTVTYTHDGTETTTDSFTYTIQDASGAVSNGATVSLTVNSANDPPTAVADTATVDEGSSVVIDLAANDTDLDNALDLTSIVITSGPANGTLVVNNDGTVTYTHDGSETTTDSFTYTIQDASGAVSNGATVSLTVNPVNDAPTAVADTATVDEGASVVIDLAANDTDLDGAIDLTSIVITSGPANGTLVVNNDGTVTYTHDGTETTTDSFTYTIQDASGAVSNGATVSLTVNSANDPPTAVADTATVDEGNSVVIDLAANDTDLDNALDLTSIVITSGPANGTLVVNNDGTVTYTHDGSETTTDSFTYTIQDASGAVSNGATVSLTVNPINDAPTVADFNTTVPENSAPGTFVGQVSAADADGGDSLVYQIVSGNVGGAFSIDGNGTIRVADSAMLDYEAVSGFDLTVMVTDTVGASATASVRLDVTNVNEAPTLDGATFTVSQDTGAGSVIGEVVALDPDAADQVTYLITGGNLAGAFAIDADGSIRLVDPLAVADQDSFSLTVEAIDLAGAAVSTSVEIEISPRDVGVSDPPVTDPPPSDDPPVTDPAPVVPIIEIPVIDTVGSDPSNPPGTPAVVRVGAGPAESGTVADEGSGSGQPGSPDGSTSSTDRPIEAEGDAGAFISVRGEAISFSDSTAAATTDLEERSTSGREAVRAEAHSEARARGQARLAMERVRAELTSAAEQAESDTAFFISTTEGIALLTSAGFLASLLRTGSLAAVAVSSLPLWSPVDPLAVLAMSREERERHERELKAARDEDGRVGSVLDPDDAEPRDDLDQTPPRPHAG